MAITRVAMSVALMVPAAAAEAAADAGTWANQSASLRGSSTVEKLSSMDAGCTASWAHNCKDNPTCCEAGFTCFQKTPNWAACLQTCEPGVAQPNDHGAWTCTVLGREDPGCADKNPQCQSWAADAQCSANPAYMHEFCRLSCGLCQGSTPPPSAAPSPTPPPSTSPKPTPPPSTTPSPTPPPSTSSTSTLPPSTTTTPSPAPPPSTSPATAPQEGTCEDANQQCLDWAAGGECSANPVYMHQSCKLSCGLCQACEDRTGSCAEWAAQNQCEENPGYMNVMCKKSCGQCS